MERSSRALLYLLLRWPVSVGIWLILLVIETLSGSPIGRDFFSYAPLSQGRKSVDGAEDGRFYPPKGYTRLLWAKAQGLYALSRVLNLLTALPLALGDWP